MPSPYPTAAEIKTIFELENRPSPKREEFLSHVAEDFHLKVISNAHPFPRKANKEDYGQILVMQEGWMHGDHPFERSVGVVTGGGDNEWAAVELFNYGRTKAGMFRLNSSFLL